MPSQGGFDLWKIGIVGAGAVGTAVGLILSSRGHEITGVCDIRPESTGILAERTGAKVYPNPEEVSRSAQVLFITTSDGSIPQVVEDIAKKNGFLVGQAVIHMSGALSSRVLDPARSFGAYGVSVHPMQSFASVDRAISNLPGSVFSIEGDEEIFPVATKLVEDLGGEFFFIDEKSKPLYHAGACVVSNYLVTLVECGLRLLEAIGITREQALRAFLPLVKGTVTNIEMIGVPRALTGPIARGDVLTVLKHMESLADKVPEVGRLYAWLGYYTAEVALSKGTIDQERMLELKKLFATGIAGRAIAKAGGEWNAQNDYSPS